MWIPETAAELEHAVASGSLEETVIFDAKRELSTKSQEIAKDIAAMANNGGVIIYGIDQDEHKRLTVLNPIPLADQRERIDNIVQTSIQEPPVISIKTLPRDSDPSTGYIVVIVPPSERAPHMVVVKGEHRFYGRSATGNIPLNEGDVARLYERRQRSDVDREKMLTEEIQQTPFGPEAQFAFLHLVARPVIKNEDLLERTVRSGQTIQSVLRDLVMAATHPDVFPNNRYAPDFNTPQIWIHRTEGFLGRLYLDKPSHPGEALDLQIDFDGSGHLFCGRAAEQHGDYLQFFPPLVAGNTIRFISLLGNLYAKARYLGMVDIGLALTGLKGSVPNTENIRFGAYVRPYERDEYRRTDRLPAHNFRDDPYEIARRLLTPLFNAMSQGRINLFPYKKEG